jgi:hypothetical protein
MHHRSQKQEKTGSVKKTAFSPQEGGHPQVAQRQEEVTKKKSRPNDRVQSYKSDNNKKRGDKPAPARTRKPPLGTQPRNTQKNIEDNRCTQLRNRPPVRDTRSRGRRIATPDAFAAGRIGQAV